MYATDTTNTSSGDLTEQVLDKQGNRRSRVSFTQDTNNLLMELFDKCQYPDFTERVAVAERIGVSESRIQVWYQNRRTRLRRKNHIINKPSNLPGPRVRLGMGGISDTLPASTKSATTKKKSVSPIACIVQPQPRFQRQGIASSEFNTYTPIKQQAKKRILHSVENILHNSDVSHQIDNHTYAAVMSNCKMPMIYNIKPEYQDNEDIFQDQPLDLSMPTQQKQRLFDIDNSIITQVPMLFPPIFPAMIPFLPFMTQASAFNTSLNLSGSSLNTSGSIGMETNDGSNTAEILPLNKELHDNDEPHDSGYCSP